LHALLTSIGGHPQLALAVILLAAFLESVAFIGTAVPAAIVMFAGGALVGAGLLDLWLTLGLAALGAVAGDGLSYELGHHYAQRIRDWRLLKRYRDMFARGERFVARHGGKSILLARFIAPVRAVVPVIAGITRLPRLRFYTINILSAALWAPAHILPGLVFGASLQLAEAVTGRLGLLLLLVAALLWLSVRLIRLATEHALPWLGRGRDAAVRWARGRPGRLAHGVMFFLDPYKPQSEALLVAALILLASGWLFLGIVEDVATQDRLVQLDVATYHFLHGLRTSVGDRIMLVATGLGSVAVLLPLTVLVAAWLALRRCWQSLRYWIAAALLSQLLIALLKFALQRQRPFNPYPGDLFQQFAFPSGHATSSAVIYGFLAFLLAHRQRRHVRISVYAAVAVLVTLIGFSRLYLGAHWLSDVLGGFSLGLTGVALLSMLHTHYQVHEDVQHVKLAAIVAGLLALYAPWQIGMQLPAAIARYAPRPPLQRMDAGAWLGGGWKHLPQHRVEAAGDREEAFTLQWAASADTIAAALKAAGWQPAPPWTARSALLWLLPATPPAQLPVLPKFNRGSESQLAFVMPQPQQSSRLVLRLWRSDYTVQAGGRARPLWYGGLYRERFHAIARMVLVYRSTEGGNPARLPGLATLPGARTATQAGAPPILLLLP